MQYKSNKIALAEVAPPPAFFRKILATVNKDSLVEKIGQHKYEKATKR
jgi:hypothetical protein